MHTGTMENNQDFDATQYQGARNHGIQYFEVTYLDTDCGRIRTELFDDAAAADRFASRRIADADGWAVIDAVPVKAGRAAA